MTRYKALSPVPGTAYTFSKRGPFVLLCTFLKVITTANLPNAFLTSYWKSSCYRQLLQGKKDLQLQHPNELTGHRLQRHHPGKHTRYMWWLHSESLRPHTAVSLCESWGNIPNRLLPDSFVTLRLCLLRFFLKKKKTSSQMEAFYSSAWKRLLWNLGAVLFVSHLGSPRISF